jgi:hypothetical protein
MVVGWLRNQIRSRIVAAALLAGACGDDDELPNDASVVDDEDAGDPGEPEDAGDPPMDAGQEDAAAQAVMCGGKTCAGHSILGMVTLDPGCAESALGAEVCGLSSSLLLMGNEPRFMEKNAPGAESTGCGEYLDRSEPEPDGGATDGGSKSNGRIDLTLVGRTVSLPGCCTKSGVCSGDFANGKTAVAGVLIDLNAGFGCMDPAILFRGAAAEVRSVPCNPDTGAVLIEDAGGDAGATGDAGTDGG